MENQEGETQVIIPSSDKPILLILTIAVFAALLLLSGIKYFFLSKTPVAPKIQSQPQAVQLPKRNIFVYTRCFGGDWQPNRCGLYVQSLDDKEEKLIYTFSFDKVKKQNENAPYNGVSLSGVTGNYVVYTRRDAKAYIFGVINLSTGKATELFSTPTRVTNTSIQIMGAPTSDDHKIYFTESDNKSSRLIMYDPQTNTHKTLTSLENSPGVVYFPFGVSGTKVLLTHTEGYPGAPSRWWKTFDTATGKVTDVQKEIYSPLYVDGAIFFFETEKIPGSNTVNVLLKKTDANLLSEQTIYSLKNTYTYGYSGPTESYSNLTYARWSNMIGVMVELTDLKNSQRDFHKSYVIPLKDLAVPYDDSTAGNLIRVSPETQVYKWITYLKDDVTLHDMKAPAMLFKIKYTWYLKDFAAFPASIVDIMKDAQPILIGADNVFFVDTLQ
ncbi:MAG TPA: hypothetical protein VEW42_01985 [Candidatus Eisenbacteria bacterium]|nr:hypothetical protein [Candidatus Eisenbacteria bacterium]